jgi:4,5-dihydroxyphthalate decarboxylase
MHVVVLRRDVYEQRPWLAASLYKAFDQARLAAVSRLAETAAGRYLLPWADAEVERTRRVMGTDLWTYGLAGNEETLTTFLRYAREQGLIKTERSPAALFAPETLESFVNLSQPRRARVYGRPVPVSM